MRSRTAMLALAALLGLGQLAATAAGLEAGKDCQALLSCNFVRGAAVRGCLSSYSCRQCRFSRRATVTIDGQRRAEYGTTCQWGAGN